MSKKILLTIIFLLAVVAAGIGEALNYDQVFKEWKGATVRDLKDRGNECLEAGRMDSALIYYTMAANKYRPEMPASDKAVCAGAYNNAGYIYFFYRNDYTSSYTSLLKAQEIVEETGIRDILPCVYLNMGNIYISYKDYDASTDLYRKAVRVGVEVRDWQNLLTALCNLVSECIANGTPKDAEKEVRLFRRLDIPHMPMLDYAKAVCDAAEAQMEGDYLQTIRHLQRSKTLVDTPLTPERFLVGADMQVAQLLLQHGEYGKAKAIALRVEHSTRGVALDLQAEACDILSQICASAGQPSASVDWRSKGLQLSDSLFRSQQYGLIHDMKSTYEIKKIDQKMQQAESRRATMQTALAIVALALLVVGLLALLILKKNRKLTRSNRQLFLRNEEVMRLGANERRQREVYERRIAECEQQLSELRKQGGCERGKYQGSTLDDYAKQQLLDRISKVMDEVGVISETDFSVERLARLVESNSKYVSQVINETYGKNFNSLLGEVRVRQACQRLCDEDQYGNLTIEAIAEGLGFKSRSNFVTVFKRVTGLTPSDYKKIGTSEKTDEM